MKLSIKKIFILLFITTVFANGSTMYILTKLPSVYLVVEDFSNTMPKEVIKEIKNELKVTTDELKISTKGYSHRTFGVIISNTIVGGKGILRVELVLGEIVRRIDDNEEVYAITYQKLKHLSTDTKSKETLQEEVIEAVELLIYDFKEQYIEDNK